MQYYSICFPIFWAWQVFQPFCSRVFVFDRWIWGNES